MKILEDFHEQRLFCCEQHICARLKLRPVALGNQQTFVLNYLRLLLKMGTKKFFKKKRLIASAKFEIIFSQRGKDTWL